MRFFASCTFAAALLAAPPLVAQQPAPYDPHAPVYLVSSRDTWDTSLSALAREPDERRDALGQPVVVSRIAAHQVEDISRLVHDRERRCGGFFSFPSRDAALAFLAADQSGQAALASTVDYTIDQQSLVAGWMAEVNGYKIGNGIAWLSGSFPNRYYLSTHGKRSAEQLRFYWRDLARGRPDVSAQLFTDCADCGIQPSVVLTIQGTERPDEVVVIGGHLDSISSAGTGDAMDAPGADDNASGVAVLSEVIGVALADGWRPQRTVKFIAYAAEEVGLRGSKAIANAHREAGVDVVGVLQLDMTNYHTGNRPFDLRLVDDYSNAPLQQFVRDLFDTYLAPSGMTRGASACGYACSDHASWTAAGYPAAFITEPVTFPGLHTPEDRVPNIGSSGFASVKFAQLALAFLAELAKTAPPPDVGDSLRAVHDLNGDDRSDLLWRHGGTGANTVWLSARSGTRLPLPRVVDPAWSVVAIGDFDGDREDDLFWRHATTGANTVWRSGRSARRMPIRDVTDTSWEVVGTGDFDGDGLDDVVWRQRGTGANTIWRGANADAPLAMADDGNLNWEVAGIGDFDADGLSDVFWQHRTNDARRYWPSADASRAVAVRDAGTLATVPTLHVGDFDGNGRSEMVSKTTVDGIRDPDTRIVATGDYDGDGKSDIVFHNDRTGANTIWLGGRASERQAMPAVRDPAWTVQP